MEVAEENRRLRAGDDQDNVDHEQKAEGTVVLMGPVSIERRFIEAFDQINDSPDAVEDDEHLGADATHQDTFTSHK